MYRYFKNKIRDRSISKRAKGFTLPEMIISLGIMMVISSIILTNQAAYTEGASLSNLADNLSLSITQAQVYGVSVRESNAGSLNFSSAYGMDFRLAGAGGSESSYIFFVDRNGDLAYTGSWDCPSGESSECVEKTGIESGNYIESLCVLYTDDTESCDMGRVSIAFLRPDTRARFLFFNSAGNQTFPSNVKGAKVNIFSPNGLNRSVSVYTTGYISTQ